MRRDALIYLPYYLSIDLLSRDFRRMKTLSTILLLVYVCSAAAQDGPIRQRIKDRMLEREQQKPAPTANANVQDPITKPGTYTFAIQHGGLTRRYMIHVPASYDPAKPTALLFALHGGGGHMEYQANDTGYGQISAAEKYGFVAVFPNGYSKFDSGRLATWNAGNCCGASRDRNIDDAGFIRQIFGNLSRQMPIDRNRVYATGMSNGGLMSYRLACEMSDVFRAIAPVAGTDNTRSCNPSQPVSVLHIHAKNDTHVLFSGGVGPDSVSKEVITDFTSVPDTIVKWVKLNGCTTTAKRILEKEGAYCDLYSPCRDNTEVQLCVTEAGGHSWPGGTKKRSSEGPSKAISANEVMWEFFRRH